MSNKINSSTIGAGGLISTADGDDGILLIQSNGSTVATFNATGILGDGSQLTSLPAADLSALNATNLTSGTVPDARFPATLPAANGSALTNLTAGNITGGVGKILQVLTVYKTSTWSTTSSSLVDVTGLTVAITPSATSSKILVFCYVNGVSTDNAVVQLQRNGTIIAAGDASGSRTRSFAGGFYAPGGLTLAAYTVPYLDSPASTSAQTYKVQGGAVGGGTLYLGKNASDDDNSQHTRTPQIITVMEVAA